MLLAPFFRGLARHLFTVCLALTAVTATVSAQINTPSAADGFDPNVDGNVYAIAAQPDGKFIVAGQFGNLQPNGGISIARKNIARVNPDGSLDGNFDPNANGAVRAVIIQPDGRILIGGDFTQVGGVTRNRVARLNADGSLDTTFSPSINGDLQPQVFALALQADGSVVVGGNFSSAQSTGSATTVTRNNLARFSRAGVLDTAYNPNPNGLVLALAVHVQNKIVVGGGFTQFQENGKPSPTTRLRIARLNPDGTVDSEFDPKADNGVTSLAVQADGKIVVGGYFTSLQPIGNDAPQTRNHLGRLNPDGTLDSEFYPIIAGNVLGIAVAQDGGLYIGGHFTQVWGRGNVSASRSFVARFSADGTIDPNFNPGVNGDVDAFAFQPDGQVILGGYFTRAQAAGVTTAVVRNHIARVLPNGSLDATFQLNEGGRILASIVQTDGKIVVAGSFTSIGGVTRNYIARLNTDGSVDTAYNPNVNAPIYTLAYQSKDNKVLIGGAFTTVGTDIRDHIARLNPNDGSVDSEFNVRLDGSVGSMVVQGDGNILVGGSFLNAQPFGDSSSTARAYLLRLTSAGKLDTTFNPTPNNSISAIALQSDNKIVIAGGFTTLQPGATGDVTGRNYIARLNADGTIDSGYNPNANAAVSAVALQSDGKAIIAGRFTDLLPNNATTVVARNFLARLNTDGTVDTAWDPHPNNFVFTIAVQPSDQKIVIGGAFTTLQPQVPTVAADWTLRKYVARVTTDGQVDTSFNLDLNEQIGNRVDSITVAANGDLFIGGTFISLQPTGTTTRVLRNHFVRVTSAGAIVTTFDPGAGGSATGTVKAIAVEPDGTVLVGGSFTDLGGAKSTNIARFRPEGNADTSFNAALTSDGSVNAIAVRGTGAVTTTQLGGFGWFNANGSLRSSFKPTLKVEGNVNAALVQPDGKVIVAGAFSDITNTISGSLARFNPDGTLDTGFNVALSGAVLGMVRQPDGQIIIVGDFISVNGTTRNHIARLNAADGSPDGFDPNANGTVSAVLLQTDGKVIFGGSFTNLTPNGASAAVTRNYLARVNADGTVDTGFDPNLNGSVNALAFAFDGKIVAGGAFTTTQPNGGSSSFNRLHTARFNTDGTLDQNFEVDPNGTVFAVATQSDGSIIFGGAFNTVQVNWHGNLTDVVTRNGIVRVGSDGLVDTSFDPNANGAVTSIVIAPNGSMLLAGAFTTLQPNGGTVAIARNNLARINNDGSLDITFNPDVAGTVSTASLASDGSILVGGSFTTLQSTGLILVGGAFNNLGGVPTRNVAELNGDGSVNSSFQPNPDKAVNALLPLADGRFVVGGAFTSIAGAARNGLARFSSDGTLDAAFNPASVGTVTTLAQQSDGKLLVGGNSVVRLNTDGTRDSSFNAGAPFAPAVAMAVQPDGKVIVAGPGSGVPPRILRLNADGSVDSSFTTVSFTGATDVQTLALQADGSIIVAGAFTNIGGTSISRLARLLPTGKVDTSFNPVPNQTVTALALQSDGRLIIGGNFSTVGGLPRVGLARLANTAPATQTLGVSADGKTVTWVRGGTAAELSAVSFDWSTDGVTWSLLGIGTRATGTGTWQLTGISGLPTSGSFYVRARGIAPSSAGTSASAYQAVRLVNLASPVSGVSSTVAAVVSAVAWDETHLAWTLDPITGVLRISDVLSAVVLDPSRTILINGSQTPPVAASSARLADLATRGNVSPSTPLISGFAVTGSGPRAVLVRAIGPALANFGVTDYLKAPQLVLFNNATGAEIGRNAGWSADPNLSATFVRTGAFPLTPGSADAALLVTLNPGTYSVQVADAGGAGSTGGNALVEIYDAGSLTDGATRIMNLSSRGTVPANGTLIGGLVISGSAPKTLLVRGVGPALTKFGVSGVLANPSIAVYDAQGNVLASNDDWAVSTAPAMSAVDYSNAVVSAANVVGAFALDPGSKDAALVITLPAGAYTVQVSGAAGAGGAALIEVYELPQ